MDWCEDCAGNGYFVEFYGGWENYDGTPNERIIGCKTCEGTGMVDKVDEVDEIEEWESED